MNHQKENLVQRLKGGIKSSRPIFPIMCQNLQKSNYITAIIDVSTNLDIESFKYILYVF